MCNRVFDLIKIKNNKQLQKRLIPLHITDKVNWKKTRWMKDEIHRGTGT